jgi:hypothetical protein
MMMKSSSSSVSHRSTRSTDPRTVSARFKYTTISSLCAMVRGFEVVLAGVVVSGAIVLSDGVVF